MSSSEQHWDRNTLRLVPAVFLVFMKMNLYLCEIIMNRLWRFLEEVSCEGDVFLRFKNGFWGFELD